ncbi:hypothetical protein EC973_005296 [Apophysomyces ossiformis]|uniref:F-box domain-containing protein n=1 Tax=Apophysomyces ossiformis TaxID=679940 RepID=A0A8H7BUG7_9FUNG|nr:hypothetical protein EC973_005296 [Apophysomyces ossiformis]
MPRGILDLNNELLTCIAGHLAIEDLEPFSLVCTRFASITRHDAIWKEMLANHYGVTYKLPNETWQDMYRRKHNDMQDNRICPHVGRVNQQLGETRGDPSEAYYVNMLLEMLTQNTERGRQAMREKNQCMHERLLYADETDRAVVLKSRYYLVDRVWICSWFLRLCDGKIGVGPVTNMPLEAEDGKVNPSARPRGAFSGGFSIVTPHLWHYLVETYGLAGKEFTSGVYYLL